jgi:hypothetical protein
MPVAVTPRIVRSTLVGIVVMLTCAVPGAGATVVDHGSFSGTETGVPDEICGIAVVRDSVFSGTFRIRAGKGATDQAFFQRLNFRAVDTLTNPANGRFLSLETQSNSNEIKATRVSGNIFQFTTVEAGQPFAIRDSAGRIVLRDRGAIRRTLLFDTLGDSAPGGVTLDEAVVRVSGPHPLFDMTEDEFCATIEDLIG